jgi:hypothetical protein
MTRVWLRLFRPPAGERPILALAVLWMCTAGGATLTQAMAMGSPAGAVPDPPDVGHSERAVVPPQLVIEAPQELAGVAARIERFDRGRLISVMRLAGLEEPGPPIRIVLAPEHSDLARSVPEWIAGYAIGNAGVVVLFPGRTPSYPDASLEELLHHEVSHVLVARAAGGRPVPRWFNEGLALAAERAWGLEDRTRMAIAALSLEQVPLAELEERFGRTRQESARAYVVSGAFVRDLLRQHGPDTAGRILARMGPEASFDAAFQEVTGLSIAAAEQAFWDRQTFWVRWMPVLTSPAFFWFLVALLAILAFRRHRQRSAARRRQWEEEEAWHRSDHAPEWRTPTDPDDESDESQTRSAPDLNR